MNSNLKLFTGLLAFWVVLSEKLSLEVLLVGSMICIGIVYINRTDKDTQTLGGNYNNIRKVYYYFVYALVLIKEVVISNIQVAKVVLSRDMDISPCTFVYSTKLSKDKYRTIFANSITLTPGTITVSMDNDKIIVHCLKKENIDSVVESQLEKILLKIEG